jgi:hypothetical protein
VPLCGSGLGIGIRSFSFSNSCPKSAS